MDRYFHNMQRLFQTCILNMRINLIYDTLFWCVTFCIFKLQIVFFKMSVGCLSGLNDRHWHSNLGCESSTMVSRSCRRFLIPEVSQTETARLSAADGIADIKKYILSYLFLIFFPIQNHIKPGNGRVWVWVFVPFYFCFFLPTNQERFKSRTLSGAASSDGLVRFQVYPQVSEIM